MASQAISLRVTRAGTSDAAPMVRALVGASGTSWAGLASVDVGALRLAPGDAVRGSRRGGGCVAVGTAWRES